MGPHPRSPSMVTLYSPSATFVRTDSCARLNGLPISRTAAKTINAARSQINNGHLRFRNAATNHSLNLDLHHDVSEACPTLEPTHFWNWYITEIWVRMLFRSSHINWDGRNIFHTVLYPPILKAVPNFPAAFFWSASLWSTFHRFVFSSAPNPP